ncbi:MAG: hypothetical protein FJW61_01870 [Actinobacteria bacterium]|nr:hypothetical protein [Actinomycetota bacterium]MBM3709156.1 hypothetical protein [Actinomycetota bacterium]MBM3713915.1 hypothetical protein [Actinomycetota bacterium]
MNLNSSKRKIISSLGFYGSLIQTIVGVVYFIVISTLFITGNNTMPPSENIQLFGAIVTIIMAPLLLIMITAIHYVTSQDKKILSHLAIIFCTIFAALVSINRFVQLIVVRVSVLAGDLEGLKRFYPYETGSAMLALEYTGWGIFLSLALLSLAFVFSSDRLQRSIQIFLFLYAILGIAGSIAFIANSPLWMIGMAAWGFILPIATGLLSVFFFKIRQTIIK